MPSLGTGWNAAKNRDTQKSSRGAGGRKYGYRFKFDQTPTKVHFSMPEKLYVHPDTGVELPWRTGVRYYVPWGGKNGKGTYIEVGEQSVIEAYRNPAQFGLDISARDDYRKLDPKIYYAVSGWVEEWFHRVEGKTEDGKTFFERERCSGRGCKNCQAQTPRVFGKKVYFEIARTHWNESLFGINEYIESNCKCGGFIYKLHYECPSCKNMLVDMANQCSHCQSSDLSINIETAEATCNKCQANWSLYEDRNPEIAKLVHKDMVCPNCRNEVIPSPVTVCTNAETGCKEPDPYNLFDCQMSIQMVGSPDGKFKEMKVEDIKIQPPDEKLFDPKYQGPNSEDAVKFAEANKKPIDLDYLLAPPSPDEEARLLNVQNPFNPKGMGTTTTKAYNRGAAAQAAQASDGDEGADEPPEGAEGSVVIRQPPKGPTMARIGIRR